MSISSAYFFRMFLKKSTVFANHILGVVLLGPKEKVIRINTFWIVAFVQDTESIGDWPEM